MRVIPLVSSPLASSSASSSADLPGPATSAPRVDLEHEIERYAAVGSLGFLDYSAATSSTAREALTGLVTRCSLFTHLRLALDLWNHEVHLRMVSPRSDAREHRPELVAAIFVLRARQLCGDAFVLHRASFRDAPCTPALRGLLGAPVETGAQADELVFAENLLELPVASANPGVARLLEDHVTRLQTARDDDDFLERLREAVAGSLAAGAHIQGCSAALHVTPRTLQRRLQRVGTSFSEVVESVRRERAIALLQRSAVPLAEVAASLAFSDLSAFYRAFRRWTGETPAAFRRRSEIGLNLYSATG